ncbi:hypothetical protein FQN57_002064 [Myotisia sp. PD_48]|nr:hypothetical protein FQN57_002064 [Myotisia sp. PD_48]
MAQSAAADRIRENQRRSRARRKEYIQHLETQLQKYERVGVEATLEVQTAARKVAQENAALRLLLQYRGVSDLEINEYLHRSAECSANVAKNGTFQNQKPTSISGANPPMASTAYSEVSGPSSQHTYPQTYSSGPVDSSNLSGLAPAGQTDPQITEYRSNPTIPPADKTTRYDSSYTVENDISIRNSTSCEEAARIIASMRGDYNDESVRAELGCSTNGSCRVENMKIFSILDI